MGAPPSEDAIATMLDDPNMQQMMNEALNNPEMINMMIQSTPHLRNNPRAREMLQSPEFRAMLTNPEALRQAAQLRRMMGGGAGASAFPAPGVTDTTPSGAAGTNPNANQPNATPFNPFIMPPGAFAGGNPFAQLFGQGAPSGAAGQTPSQSPPPPASAGQGTTPLNTTATNAPNPFAAFFGGAGDGAGANSFQYPGMPAMTPEMMQQALEVMRNGGFNDFLGGGAGGFGGAGGAGSPPPPVDTRPPEERYADQLRQLNDMGFFDFDRNVEALRRSGGSVQGAIEQLLR